MNLKEWRMQERRPMSFIGLKCKVSRQAVDNWERGLTVPSEENAALIEEITGGAIPASSWPRKPKQLELFPELEEK